MRTARCRQLVLIAALSIAAISVVAPARAAAETVRVATFNLALYDQAAGRVLARLEAGDDPQARHLAEIIQRVRPDILVLNEIDYDADGRVLAAFCEKYLAVGQNVSNSPAGPAKPIEFAHRMQFASNTGEHSGLDLDRNGRVDATPGAADYAGDCWGYGVYPGQYAFAVLSRFPLDAAAAREFRKFRWKDMPGALVPDDPATSAAADWYSAEELEQVRLSSKNHCDVPVTVEGREIHLLLSHPTPPVFDGAEDRNGRRNHDELRFWKDYIASFVPAPSRRRGGEHRARATQSRPSAGGTLREALGRGETAGTSDTALSQRITPPLTPPHQGERNGEDYFRDDAGRVGGLPAGASFIILGDLNGDAFDGDGAEGITQLLAAPQVLEYPAPTSRGAAEAAQLQGGANARHKGDAAADTEDAADERGPGNLRLDYVLPSRDLKVVASGVFWPETSDPLAPLVAGAEHPASSDHRLTWVDLEL